ncbi:hypothetical protein HPB48_009970 [Haemaphysalis longicornis]|uniref:Uncharacterized protein n=1 Tax=Haemaphysalis longicornis TaxID=44386 RepID=A0A9J6FXQ6_HAELO|nr:hypothetical protein HPB48_009970 [Haemaphysalis longicornis]
MTRGGPKFPRPLVVNVALHTDIVLDKLRSKDLAAKFLTLPNQKEIVVSLVPAVIDGDRDLEICDFGHSPQQEMSHILSAAANTLLNYVCKTESEKICVQKPQKAKRKLQTLTK